MNFTFLRSPSFSKRSMTSFMPVIVVVRSADIPMAFASGLSFRPCTNLSADTSMPGPLAHHLHQVLADVVQVALHGSQQHLAHRFTPAFTSSGFRISMLWFMARAAIRTSGI